MDEPTRPEMGRNESEVSYVTARETADDERPVVPVVLEPIIQVEHPTSTTTNTAMGTTAKPGTGTGTAPTTPIKSSLTTHISRTRSGSGTRFSPSSNPHNQSQTGTTGGSVARRGSLVEASAGLQKWWNSVRNPGVAEEHGVAEEEGNDVGLKREVSRSRDNTATTGPTTTAGPSGNSTNAVFGERLEMSLIYAAVPISTARHEGSSAGSASGSGTGSGAGSSGLASGAGATAGTGVGSGTGESYVWGYVPVVVAKWYVPPTKKEEEDRPCTLFRFAVDRT